MLLLFPILLCSIHNTLAKCSVTTAFYWEQLNFNISDDEWRAMGLGTFIPENNIPKGMAVYGDRIFMNIPRDRPGVAASLVYINKTDDQRSPALRPYPDWASHDLTVPDPQIVSPVQIHVDRCGRLWVSDYGMEDMQLRPKLMVFNLSTNLMIRSYLIPNYLDASAQFEVDDNDCDNSSGYLTYFEDSMLFSIKNNTSEWVKSENLKQTPLDVHTDAIRCWRTVFPLHDNNNLNTLIDTEVDSSKIFWVLSRGDLTLSEDIRISKVNMINTEDLVGNNDNEMVDDTNDEIPEDLANSMSDESPEILVDNTSGQNSANFLKYISYEDHFTYSSAVTKSNTILIDVVLLFICVIKFLNIV